MLKRLFTIRHKSYHHTQLSFSKSENMNISVVLYNMKWLVWSFTSYMFCFWHHTWLNLSSYLFDDWHHISLHFHLGTIGVWIFDLGIIQCWSVALYMCDFWHHTWLGFGIIYAGHWHHTCSFCRIIDVWPLASYMFGAHNQSSKDS